MARFSTPGVTHKIFLWKVIQTPLKEYEGDKQDRGKSKINNEAVSGSQKIEVKVFKNQRIRWLLVLKLNERFEKKKALRAQELRT